ncbi:GntR family transcriptional regulator, partial [Streptomyces alkaliphilus]|nr:GntR family transcriptional regulator [Streptomyces alkaliphilus]
PGQVEEVETLGGRPGRLMIVISRTFRAGSLPVETADLVVPADRYRIAYHLPVR